jgi:RNA polymerase sigma factor (sigma-70 family)
LVSAWKGLGGFEERSSLRTWLYQIATRQCLNARRSVSRRRAKEQDVPRVEWPEPTRFGEIVWLQPFPDALLEGSIAFVTSLQVLPPRQLAVLILRDVLGFEVNQVADILNSTVLSVNSALKRARVKLRQRFGVDEWHGTNAFIRDGEKVFRTYFVNLRGDEAMGSTWSYLDLTALGRQEEWEDSPEGYPQTPPYAWWNWHDEYVEAKPSEPELVAATVAQQK